MKTFLPVAIAAALAGCATPYAPRDFDFSELTSGTIESVHEVPRDIHAFEEAIVHKINPEVAAKVRIRLDDGRAVTLRENHIGHFAPGERVRVVAGRRARE